MNITSITYENKELQDITIKVSERDGFKEITIDTSNNIEGFSFTAEEFETFVSIVRPLFETTKTNS